MTTPEARVQSVRKRLASLAQDIEQLIVWDEAISLAYAERTGRELRRGEKYSAEDALRAEEIMRLYPGTQA